MTRFSNLVQANLYEKTAQLGNLLKGAGVHAGLRWIALYMLFRKGGVVCLRVVLRQLRQLPAVVCVVPIPERPTDAVLRSAADRKRAERKVVLEAQRPFLTYAGQRK